MIIFVLENNSTDINCKLETKHEDKLGSSRLDYPLMWTHISEHTHTQPPPRGNHAVGVNKISG